MLAETNICPENGQENPTAAFLLPLRSSDPDHLTGAHARRCDPPYFNSGLFAPLRNCFIDSSAFLQGNVGSERRIVLRFSAIFSVGKRFPLTRSNNRWQACANVKPKMRYRLRSQYSAPAGGKSDRSGPHRYAR
jgi:hypothetical protein